VPHQPIPDSVIASVKANTSFLSLLRGYGLVVTRRGESYFATCPFHDVDGHAENTPSLSIDTQRNLYHCFGCSAKGNVIQFVQAMEKVDFRAAVAKLLALKPTPETVTAPATKEETPSTPPAEPVTPPAAPQRCELLEQALTRMVDTYAERAEGKEYLEGKRGLRLDGIEVGYCGPSFAARLTLEQRKGLMDLGLLTPRGKPHFGGCVVFPLRSVDGTLTGLYGRNTKGDGHYYMRGERTGVFALHQDGSDTVTITESVIDAISVQNIGGGSVLALHGVNGFTPTHRQWLIEKGISTVHLLLDGDSAGREAATRLALQLRTGGWRTHVLELPAGEDPNSYFSFAAHGLAELRRLPGYPSAQSDSTLRAERHGEDLVIRGERVVYTVHGLAGHGLDRLRVTIKAALASDPSGFYIDNLDLYSARARGSFIEGLTGQLGGNSQAATAELNRLIGLLERERLRLREQSSGGEKKTYEMSDAERQEAMSALRSPTLLADIVEDFRSLGMIGEEKGKLLCYLGTVSRLLPYPLGILIVSRSGAGKTTLQDAACALVPEESLVKYTRLTGQALFYKDSDSLKHKVLAIEEEEGMQQAMYAVRTLQSSQNLRVASTRSDPKSGKLRTDEYQVEGPVAIFIATTNPDALDAETKNRFVILTIDESREQTLRIMEHFKQGFTLAGRLESRDRSAVVRKHGNMQRLLRPLEVVNNYAPHLDWAFERLQMRREVRKYFTLIESVAILRQHQKTVKFYTKEGVEHRYIEVDAEDIAAANELAAEFFRNSLDELAPHTRSLAAEIVSLIQAKGGECTFSRKELRDHCGWSDWSVRQGLGQLENLGYVGRRSGANGILIVYELLVDPAAEQRSVLLLTAAEQVAEQLKPAAKKKLNGRHVADLVNLAAPCETL
jgi:DNA primase